MKLHLLTISILFGSITSAFACSIVPDPIPFCSEVSYNIENSLIARGQITGTLKHGIIIELFEVYRGDETRCEIKVFDRGEWDCNGIIFDNRASLMGNIGDIIVFTTWEIHEKERSWEEAGEYSNVYAEIEGLGLLSKPLVQQGNHIKGFFDEGVNSVPVNQFGERLVSCGVEGLLDEPHRLCNGLPLTIYPNPTSDRFFIGNDINQEAEVMIYDMQGKVVYHKNTYLSEDGIPVTHLPSGMYIVVVKTVAIIQQEKLMVTR